MLVYVNTAVVAAEAPVVYQLLLACMITIVWFSLVRMRLASAIFASVALMPATLFGVGFFMLPGMALTLSDLFTLIAICLYLLRPQTLYRDRFIIFLWLLVLVCALSVVAAANPIAHVGSIMRLILSVALLTIVLGSAGDSLRRHVTMAFLAWPFVMLTYLAAQEGYLWKFLSFSDGESLRVLETGNVLLGSHLIVSYLLFLLPTCFLVPKVRWLVWILVPYLVILVVFSLSRSLVIGAALGLISYLISIRGNSKSQFVTTSIGRIFFFVLLLATLAFGVTSLAFFNFGVDEGSKNTSSYIRVSKVMSSLKTWLDNPILGIGYGASSAVESRRMQQIFGDGNFDLELYLEYSVSNPETTLPQILVETGTMGAFIVFFILTAGSRFFFQALKSPSIPHYSKLILFALCVIFLTNFLGGNSFATLPFFMAMPLVFLKSRWAPVLPSDSGM